MRVLSNVRWSLTGSIFQSLRFSSTLTSPKLFVSGVCRETTAERLKEVFSPFGQLVEAKVMVNKVTGRSKGFAFVTYSTIEEAEKARESMNAKYLDGWVIFVDPARERERRQPQAPDQDTSEAGFRTNKAVGWCSLDSLETERAAKEGSDEFPFSVEGA